VEVSLPGYTRYFSKSSLFDLEEVWSSAVLAVRSLRGEVNIPLLVKPSLFEETKYEKVLNRPGIGGLVKNSPAAVSGLKAGDIIVSVGGLKASSRPQARDLLHLHHRRRSPSIAVSVLRAGEIIEATLLPDRFGYPYTPETDHHLGIIFLGAGFRPSILEDLKSLIVARRAKKVLLFSSRLVKPVLQQLLRESSLLGDIRVEVQVPQNGYFGGNIFMGDLLVVQDFIEAIQDYLETNPPPDLIVIPASPFSLGQWGRDLEGRVYTEIERAVGLPVAVLDCEPIYD
jgi:membrane-associated protease RseP (regulator of RpoE activity)